MEVKCSTESFKPLKHWGLKRPRSAHTFTFVSIRKKVFVSSTALTAPSAAWC